MSCTFQEKYENFKLKTDIQKKCMRTHIVSHKSVIFEIPTYQKKIRMCNFFLPGPKVRTFDVKLSNRWSISSWRQLINHNHAILEPQLWSLHANVSIHWTHIPYLTLLSIFGEEENSKIYYDLIVQSPLWITNIFLKKVYCIVTWPINRQIVSLWFFHLLHGFSVGYLHILKPTYISSLLCEALRKISELGSRLV